MKNSSGIKKSGRMADKNKVNYKQAPWVTHTAGDKLLQWTL